MKKVLFLLILLFTCKAVSSDISWKKDYFIQLLLSSSISDDNSRFASLNSCRPIVWDLQQQKLIFGMPDSVFLLSISHNGKLLAMWNDTNDEIYIWDIDKKERVSVEKTGKTIYEFSFVKGDKRLLVRYKEGDTLKDMLYDIEQHRPVLTYSHTLHWNTPKSISRDCKYFAVVNETGNYSKVDSLPNKDLYVVETETGNVILHQKYRQLGGTSSVAISGDNELVAVSASVSSNEPCLLVWNIATEQLIDSSRPGKFSCESLCFSDDNKYIFYSHYLSNIIEKYDYVNDSVVQSLETYRSPKSVNFLKVLNDSEILLTYGKKLEKWNTVKKERIYVLVDTLTDMHNDWIYCSALSPDGKILATGGQDYSIKLWNTTSGELIATLDHHQSWVSALAFSPDGKLLASSEQSGHFNNIVVIWDVEKKTILKKIDSVMLGIDHGFNELSFSPDGSQIAGVFEFDSLTYVIDVAEGKTIKKLIQHISEIPPGTYYGGVAVSYSPDGKYLVSCDRDSTFIVWSTEDWEVVYKEYFAFNSIWGNRTGSEVIDLVFSPDGRYLSLATNFERDVDSVRIKSTDNWKTIRSYGGYFEDKQGILYRGSFNSCAFTNDNKLFAANGYVIKYIDFIADTVLYIYNDLADSAEINSIFVSININNIHYSESGKFLITTSNKSIVKWRLPEYLSVSEPERLPGMAVFPNPVKDYVEIDNAGGENKEVAIFNISGLQVPFTTDFQSENGRLKINLTGLAPGVYFIKAGSATKMFVKE